MEFLLAQFLLTAMLIKQFIDLSKVRSESLKFRTDLLDLVMDGWSLDLVMDGWSVTQ